MKFNIVFCFLCYLIVACNPSAGLDDKPSKDKKEGFSKSDIIRMPVSANEPIDTTLVAKIDFEETTFDFGTVLEGKPVDHIFKFKNTGKVPLLISDAKATCGCTVPSFPADPIPPGQSGEISVKFNTAGKKLDQNKPVSIFANTFPAKTVIWMKGYVHPNPNK